MNTANVQYSFIENQDNILTNNTIFCPMCQDEHKNNTLCQFPTEGDI